MTAPELLSSGVVMLAPGSRFGRYTIEGLLGEGGMGTVYRAFDEKLARSVALKVVRREWWMDPNGTPQRAARLLREARAAAALEHPNVVAVYDVDEIDGAAYIAMELVDGKPLRAYVGDESVPLERRRRWLADIARALGAAHARGLVHRDVKPENVIVRSDGVVKVLDFGIARRVGGGSVAAAAVGTVTEEGVTVGTPLYMAPEQMRGEEIDGRADQFSWGVVAYELLGGRIPWRASEQPLAVVAQILGEDPEPLDAVADEVSPRLAAVIARAMAKARAARFPTMDDLVLAMEAGASPSPPPGRRAPRPWRWVALGALVTGAAALGIARRPGAALAPAPSAIALPPPSIPGPPSGNALAVAAFRDGQQADRDGAPNAASRLFRRALELDPELTAAEVRLIPTDVQMSAETARERFRRAEQGRRNLDAHDRAALEVLAPLVLPERPDTAECERRVRAFVEAHPDDAEGARWLLLVDMMRGEFATAIEDTRRPALDPDGPVAEEYRGLALAYLGRTEDAERELAACVAHHPLATACGVILFDVLGTRGACDRAEAIVRQMSRSDPGDSFAYSLLGSVLAAEGRPREVVGEALEQFVARVPDDLRAAAANEVRFSVASLYGDLDEANARALAGEEHVASDGDAASHAIVALFRAELAEERGDAHAAGDIAMRFLSRDAVWSKPLMGEDSGIATDPTPALLGYARRSGAMPESAFRARLNAWLGEWRARLEGGYAPFLWLHGYAQRAATREEADEALAALAAYGGPPPFAPETNGRAFVGRVHWLAGDEAAALAPLRAATASCDPLRDPFQATRSYALLGQALEAAHDSTAACAAYATVLARWGHATKSVTAELARARSEALRCDLGAH